MTAEQLAALAALRHLRAQCSLSADDLARLPILAAALGVAVHVQRVDWSGWQRDGAPVTVTEQVIGEVIP